MKQHVKMEIELPQEVEADINGKILTLKGPKGEVKRKLILPKVQVKIEDKKIVMVCDKATKKEYKIMSTYRAHFKNMIKGVTQGHEYKLKIVSSHFPMQVNFKNGVLEVRNFVGEKHPRTLAIPQGVEVKIEGQIITLRGVDKELLGNTAGLIEKLTSRRNFDNRIFQDGIYIIEKDGKKLV